MTKPNYAYAKQQRDLAKEQKKEEKRQRRAAHEHAHDASEETPLAPEKPIS
ncbi:MAG: hypothetical protein AAGC84_20795 [Pseudomonas sp.]